MVKVLQHDLVAASQETPDKENDDMDAILWLLMAAMIGNGLLVGASLDQSIKQLPTRHRIGVVAFSNYSKAGDLGHGIAWYAALGIGAALLTVLAAVVGSPTGPMASRQPLCGLPCC
jgi:hypothetical protein